MEAEASSAPPLTGRWTPPQMRAEQEMEQEKAKARRRLRLARKVTSGSDGVLAIPGARSGDCNRAMGRRGVLRVGALLVPPLVARDVANATMSPMRRLCPPASKRELLASLISHISPKSLLDLARISTRPRHAGEALGKRRERGGAFGRGYGDARRRRRRRSSRSAGAAARPSDSCPRFGACRCDCQRLRCSLVFSRSKSC